MRMNEFEAWASQIADQISGREYVSENEILDALKQAFLYGCCSDQSVADMMSQMMGDLNKFQSQVHEHGSRIEMISRGLDSTAAAVTSNHATMLGHATEMNARVGALEEKLNQVAKVSAHEILDNLEKMRVWALGETASETGGPAEGSAELISEQSARHATDKATPEQMAAVHARIAPYDVDQEGRVVLQNVTIDRAILSDLQVERSNIENAEIEVTDQMRAAGEEAMLDLPWCGDIELLDYKELAEAAYLAMERVRRASASV